MMKINRFALYWKVSKLVYANRGVIDFALRVKFFLLAMRENEELGIWFASLESGSLRQLMDHRPQCLGAVVWPYICISWDASIRLRRIRDHYEVIDGMGRGLAFPFGSGVKLLELSHQYESLSIIIDRPNWFIREGELAINLFIGEVRVFSLAFSFSRQDNLVIAYIGGIQGRSIAAINEKYRDMTKALYGMRPRDFLIEIFRLFCFHVGVSTILAVTDSGRHHRSSYFGPRNDKFSLNYDEVWRDRGGTKRNDDFFALEVNTPFRAIDDIPSNKRSMYRHRYDLIRRINSDLGSVIADLERHHIQIVPQG
jgi:uncharacterized protein VirK/YbjX